MDVTSNSSKKNVLSPILKFKSAVMVVIENLPWLSDKDYLFTPINSFDMKAKETLTECGGVSVFHKLIFFKHPNQRTHNELESIEWLFTVGFKFYNLCPTDIQMTFIRRASYKCYGPGRWILKEGHPPQNMYLIVKGFVRITEYVFNPVLKLMEIVEHCKLYEKHSFGESAVMFNTNRINSVQSLSKYFQCEQTGKLELISISKKDFMDVIKDNLQLQWNANAIIIKNLSYFKYLTLTELNKCSTVSFIKTFTQNDYYVLGKEIGDRDYGHFVIEGQISLIYRLRWIKSTERNANLIKEYKKKKKLTEKCMKPCIFSSGSCFNIGENIKDKEFMVFDIKETKCLCVPHWFMEKTEKLKNWTLLRLYLDVSHIIPSKDEVFKQISIGKKSV